jgi:hypothetical protein
MRVLNLSLLNREYNLGNVLKVMALIGSMCNLHIIPYQRLYLDILHYLQMECSVH